MDVWYVNKDLILENCFELHIFKNQPFALNMQSLCSNCKPN